jgi:hypothetical protein
MVPEASMFINLKLHSLIEINFSKIINMSCKGKTNLH